MITDDTSIADSTCLPDDVSVSAVVPEPGSILVSIQMATAGLSSWAWKRRRGVSANRG